MRSAARDRATTFTVFDAETLRPVRFGHCRLGDMAAQAGPGEVVLEGRWPDDEYELRIDETGAKPRRLKVATAPTIEDVRRCAHNRIVRPYPLWKQANIQRKGGEPFEVMDAYIDAVQAASNKLEAMSPIPADYTSDHRWPTI